MEEGMGPFILAGLEGCSSLLQRRCWPGLELPGLQPTSSTAAQVAWHCWHSCSLCSRTWGEELLRLITPARAGLAGLFLTLLIEAGFLLTFTLLHHYRLPGSQPPG